jgi:3-hydroxybutyryl-CoA dehydratase
MHTSRRPRSFQVQAAPVPGHSYRFPFSITQEQINAFAAISGDTNPIHLDADFAARGEFGGRIAHGVLVLGVFSKVFGTLLFADGQVLVALEARFLGPVRPDQPHIALVTVSSVDLHKARVTYSLEMMAPDGTSVLKGSCKLMNRKLYAEHVQPSQGS